MNKYKASRSLGTLEINNEITVGRRAKKYGTIISTRTYRKIRGLVKKISRIKDEGL